MKTVCEILTTDLEGGPARIPFSQFKELYTYLAEIDGEIAKEHVDTVIEHLSYDVWVVFVSLSTEHFTVKPSEMYSARYINKLIIAKLNPLVIPRIQLMGLTLLKKKYNIDFEWQASSKFK